MSDSTGIPVLEWTGERMVPHASDVATELYHWQRYQYFRPWYDGVRVIDAASGEGYGTSYAALFAHSALGIDVGEDAVRHARNRYPIATFEVQDVCTADYSSADLVISFETIEHLQDPTQFLQALSSCSGRIVISTPNRKTHSPGNRLEDKPLNTFHTIEWTPLEFAELIQQHFIGRQVRFLSQQADWPGTIREGLNDDAMYCIAVIGDGDLPQWPTIGVAIPTHNNAGGVGETILGLTRHYPGDMHFRVTANACDAANLGALAKLQTSMPNQVEILESEENLGYGRGANLGFQALSEVEGVEYYAVINDDVMPAVDCVCEMVNAMQELDKLGHKPGVIGPVSNNVNGPQRVDVGTFGNLSEMHYRAELWQRDKVNSATPSRQVRGLFLLIHPDCLREIGGFDPIFGIGNFEDDDHNLRCRLAG